MEGEDQEGMREGKKEGSEEQQREQESMSDNAGSTPVDAQVAAHNLPPYAARPAHRSTDSHK